MSTTARNITDAQIEALRADAAEAGDCEMVDICDTALNRWCCDQYAINVRREDECIAECARVISDAEAQS